MRKVKISKLIDEAHMYKRITLMSRSRERKEKRKQTRKYSRKIRENQRGINLF